MDEAVTATTNILSSITAWAKNPFSSDMNAGGWFLFFGLVIAISVAWGIVLKDLKGEL